MRVLLLGPERPRLIRLLSESGDEVEVLSSQIESIQAIAKFDFLISFGYKHVLKPEIVDAFYRRAINVHISLLPWNRGMDPNLWSFLEDTPKGVTIHYIDYGIDTGDIIVQKEVGYRDDDTLRTTYERLIREGENLLIENWENIKWGNVVPKPQKRECGTYHWASDKNKYLHLLTKGWDTPVKNLIGAALK